MLTAGPVRVVYENGFLRYLTVGGVEVLRMVYFAVRDRDWNTIPGTLSDERLEQGENTFRISYVCQMEAPPIRMRWQVVIEGNADGEIRFSIRGEALSTFLKNRTGFCVLHPIDPLKGQPCRVTHPDGSCSVRAFPDRISPHQPFHDIRSMEWETPEGTRARLDFTGDVFETEDQRNWTDASYKTYCTPLGQPFPVELAAGSRVAQQCVFTLLRSGSVRPESDEPVRIRWVAQPLPFPKLGIGAHAAGHLPTPEEAAFLQACRFSHLRIDVDLGRENWESIIWQGYEQSRALRLPIELVLRFGNRPMQEAYQVIRALAGQPRPDRLLLFERTSRLTTDRLLADVAPLFRAAWADALIVGGTDANFAEFNRHRFDSTRVDALTYSINPQVHATDDATLVENLSAQTDTVRNALLIGEGKPVHVSPVTLKPRFNAVAASESSHHLPPADYRQTTDFCAGWTLGSLKYLSEAGAASVTYFEATGERGICSGQHSFPVGHLFRWMGEWEPESVYPTFCSHPLAVSTLLLERKGERCLLLANHRSENQVVHLPFAIRREASFLMGKEKRFIVEEENAEVEIPGYQVAVVFIAS